MNATYLRARACVCAGVGLLGGAGGVSAQITLTGSVDLDFVGQPGVIVLESAHLGPPYTLSAPPLAEKRPDGVHQLLIPYAVVPSGFHVSRIALHYDCETDKLCVGYDVSNETNFFGVGTGIVGRAWDADGDGDPCHITNPFLDPVVSRPLSDIPVPHRVEFYELGLDLNSDDYADVVVSAYDNGSAVQCEPCAIGFVGPCDHTIWVTTKSSTGECLTADPYDLAVDMVYGTDVTHRDIEFSIQGLLRLSEMKGLPPPCSPRITVAAESAGDMSPECFLNFGQVLLECPCDVTVAAAKMLPDGAPVRLDARIVTCSFGSHLDDGFFYIEEDDRSCGIRVQKSGHGIVLGMRADVAGTVQTNGNEERYIDALTATHNGEGSVAPLGMPNRSIGGAEWHYDPAKGAGQKGIAGASGLNNIGLLARIWGRVTSRSTDHFTIDDGSGVQVKCVVPNGVTLPNTDDYVAVTGVISCEKVGDEMYRLIRLRTQDDTVVL